MRAFEYVRAKTTSDAVKLLTESEGAAVLAGGTDLLSLMKDEVVSPSRLVDIKEIEELSRIEESEDAVVIGAAVSLAELLERAPGAGELAAVLQAAEGISSPQILNRGTVGGELCQRPRCWYFRAGFGLLAQRDGRSMVPDGDNRYHAILGFGEGPAYFVSPSSLGPALVALGASVRIAGADGTRQVAMEDFFRVPTDDRERELALGPAEIVTAVEVPRRPQRRSATYEVRHRHALDWPLAAASVAIETADGEVTEARVVLGHVAPVPWIAAGAAEALRGAPVSEETASRAADAALREATPLSRNGYKVALARTATKRALLGLFGRQADQETEV